LIRKKTQHHKRDLLANTLAEVTIKKIKNKKPKKTNVKLLVKIPAI